MRGAMKRGEVFRECVKQARKVDRIRMQTRWWESVRGVGRERDVRM